MSPLIAFSRRWILTTLLVIGGGFVLARLGVWQLDRLAQRRIFNERVTAQMNQPQLELQGEALQADLYYMEYRTVRVRGEYDFSQEVALRNQVWGNLYGVHLLTPLRIENSQAVILVDRGWIPAEDFASGEWSRFAEPGVVEVSGILRRPQSRPDFGRISDPTPAAGERLTAWNLANLEQMQQQMPYRLLPAYIQQSPDPAWVEMPYRSVTEVEITEGPHLGYAIQWFTFAAILVFGYPVFILKEEKRSASTPR